MWSSSSSLGTSFQIITLKKDHFLSLMLLWVPEVMFTGSALTIDLVLWSINSTNRIIHGRNLTFLASLTTFSLIKMETSILKIQEMYCSIKILEHRLLLLEYRLLISRIRETFILYLMILISQAIKFSNKWSMIIMVLSTLTILSYIQAILTEM